MMLDEIVAVVLLITDQVYRGLRIGMPGLAQREFQVVTVGEMDEDDGQR